MHRQNSKTGLSGIWPTVIFPEMLAKRPKYIKNVHEAAQWENWLLITVFNEGQNKWEALWLKIYTCTMRSKIFQIFLNPLAWFNWKTVLYLLLFLQGLCKEKRAFFFSLVQWNSWKLERAAESKLQSHHDSLHQWHKGLLAELCYTWASIGKTVLCYRMSCKIVKPQD